MPKYGRSGYIDNISRKNDKISKCGENMCDFQTNSFSALRIHKKHSHEKIIGSQTEANTNYNCAVCSEIFKTEKEIRQHLRKSHKPL